MKTVMALLAKGERERAAPEPELPTDLGRLLALVDGKSSQDDPIRAAGGSTAAAGGFRWLEIAGYVENRVSDRAWQDSAWVTRPSSLTVQEVFVGLRKHLLERARQHGGAGALQYISMLEAARDLNDATPLISPLLDAVEAHSGRLVAADLAETVALILSPLEGRTSAL